MKRNYLDEYEIMERYYEPLERFIWLNESQNIHILSWQTIFRIEDKKKFAMPENVSSTSSTNLD